VLLLRVVQALDTCSIGIVSFAIGLIPYVSSSQDKAATLRHALIKVWYYVSVSLMSQST
jgi:hypothetical protein